MTVTYGGGPMCGCTSCIERDVTSNQASFPPGYDLYWEELGYLEVDQSRGRPIALVSTRYDHCRVGSLMTVIMTAPGNLHAFVYTGDGWVMMHEERQANTHDQYWDEPPHGALDVTAVVFHPTVAWCWSEMHGRYIELVAEGRITHFGRSMLQTLRPCKTMLNYAP